MAATFAHGAGPVADSAEATGVESKAASPGGGRSTAEPAERSPRYELPRPSAQPLDPSVALAVGRLVAAFGPALGLDPDAIRLGLDHVPGRAAGAATVTGGHPLIELTVGAPDAVPDRALVVHELTHVAQHANRERGLAAPDTTAAEAEAGALAAAARHGTRLWIPRAALPAGRRAADDDASGVSPRPRRSRTRPRWSWS